MCIGLYVGVLVGWLCGANDYLFVCCVACAFLHGVCMFVNVFVYVCACVMFVRMIVRVPISMFVCVFVYVR